MSFSVVLRLASILGVALGGCNPGAEPAAFVALADSMRLASVPFVIQPAAPLSANDDENLVCVRLMVGDTLRDDWAIAVRGGQPARVHAELTLVNGDVVPLPTASMSAAQYCLGPKIGGPLPSAVREVRVSSSAPIVVAGIAWVSTHK